MLSKLIDGLFYLAEMGVVIYWNFQPHWNTPKAEFVQF